MPAYRAWSESVKFKTEEVSRSTQADGVEVLTLKTVPSEPVSVNFITEARFTVRAEDWHPTALYLRVKSFEGENEYEVIENHLKVVSLADFDSVFFSDEAKQQIAAPPAIPTEKALPSPNPSASPDASHSPQIETAVIAAPVSKMPSATTKEEVEVLEYLHKIGAVIPNTCVSVADPARGLKRMVTTNENGAFIVPLLPASSYTVTVERSGFAPVQLNDVVLNVNDNRSLQIQLKVGQVGNTVTVTSEPSLIQETPEAATVVNRQFVENLPLNGRSFQSLISLTPGVVVTKTEAGSEQGQFSVTIAVFSCVNTNKKSSLERCKPIL